MAHESESIRWHVTPLEPGLGLGLHRAQWDLLNERLMGGHAMLSGAFVDALLRHLGEGDVMLASALNSAGEPVGMLLLNAKARGMGVRRSFLPPQQQIGPCLLPRQCDMRGLFTALPDTTYELDLLCNDAAFGDWQQLDATPTTALPHALTMNVALHGSFDEYWEQRPRKLIQNLRRYIRRLRTDGNGADRLVIIDTPDQMQAAVQRYAALESSGWKGRNGTALTADNAQGLFYAEVMLDGAKRGEARVYELWLGDEMLASRMVLGGGHLAVMVKTTFHEQFERFAPGRILLMLTLEDLFRRQQYRVVEFYTNADSDLLAWSTSQRWINHVSLYRSQQILRGYQLLRHAARWCRQQQLSRAEVKPVSSDDAVVECVGHPRDLPADALLLMRQSEQNYVELGADWFTLLADTVFHDASRIYLLRHQGRLLAVLPVGVQPGDTGPEVGALANFYTTLYAPILVDGLKPPDLLPLTTALRRAHRGTAAYRFWPMDPASREFRLLREALRLAGLQPREYFAFGNWHLRVNGDWATYLKNRSGQLRSTIKRMTKRLAAEPGGRLEIIRDEADVERGIAAYEAVYGASWKVPEPFVDFIPALIRLCARRGWLRLGVAWIADKPIAAQLWIVHAGRAHIYKVAYDEAFKAIAPGTLLSALLMEEVIDRDKVTEVDYLIGDDAYKKTWMSHRRERFGLIAYDPATPRGLLGLARQGLGNAWRRLRAQRTPPQPADNPAS